MTASFLQDLKRWGPDALARNVPTLDESQAYCRHLARTHYENFPVVSWLLPRRLHQHFQNVYAFCRWSDDLGDEISDNERSLELLAWWREQLADCYAGRATHPVFVALRETIAQFSLSPEPFEDLITAFEQDQHVCEYETEGDLLAYCRRSANPVGRLVLALCGANTAPNVILSDAVCTGLQLANFWQDVARDFAIGRVYLPREDRRRFGYSDDDLSARITNRPFLELMRFEVERARALLLSGLPLVERVPGRLQIDIELFIHGGLTILDRIEKIDYRVWDRRPVVTKGDVARLFTRCLVHAVGRRFGCRQFGRRQHVTSDSAVPKAGPPE